MEPQSSNSDEDRWIIRIRHNLAQALERDELVQEDAGEKTTTLPAVSIFGVPKPLVADRPETYVPQQVAIGPYHEGQPHLRDMEKYKLEAATRTQHKLVNLRFEDVVAHLVMHFDGKVRACYHRYLDVSDENLAWIMAIDASFLLEYLLDLTTNDSNCTLFGVGPRMSRVLDHYVLRDIIMLENQMPLFLLQELLSFQNHENPAELFETMLVALCTSLCPFKRNTNLLVSLGGDIIGRRAHLLEVLYYVTLPHQEDIEDSSSSSETVNTAAEQAQMERARTKNVLLPLSSLFKFPNFCRIPLTSFFKKLAFLLPFARAFKRAVGFMGKTANNPPSGSMKGSTISSIVPGPTQEELLVPSVTQLQKAGLKLYKVAGDISDVKFDMGSATLCLPVITLDHNSEVVLRNMVAYEVAAASGALVLTRYVEFLNGIVDTEEDVRLLRKSGVVLSHMKSDKEVANLWNGMGKSMKLTKVEHLDMVISDLNKWYNASWRTKSGRLVKKYVFGCWPLLTFLAANLLIAMTSLQAVCTVYDCNGGSGMGSANSNSSAVQTLFH